MRWSTARKSMQNYQLAQLEKQKKGTQHSLVSQVGDGQVFAVGSTCVRSSGRTGGQATTTEESSLWLIPTAV
jgi:hypothetical protein